MLHRFALIFWSLHIVFVFLGALAPFTGLRLYNIHSSVQFLQHFMGSDQSYGYYAPVVAPEYRVRLRGLDLDGKWLDLDMLSFNSPEAVQVCSVLCGFLQDKTERKTIAASIATSLLNRHQDLSSILVEVQYEAVPNIQEFRNGAKKYWTPMEVFVFAK